MRPRGEEVGRGCGRPVEGMRAIAIARGGGGGVVGGRGAAVGGHVVDDTNVRCKGCILREGKGKGAFGRGQESMLRCSSECFIGADEMAWRG